MGLWQLFVGLGILAVIILIIANVIVPPFINKPFFFMFKRAERQLLGAEGEFANSLTNLKADQTRKGVKLLSDQTLYSRDYNNKEKGQTIDN